jgi:hypothetical protein
MISISATPSSSGDDNYHLFFDLTIVSDFVFGKNLYDNVDLLMLTLVQH